VLVSVCFVLLRWLLEFVTLCARSKEFKELEIIILRHELAILRRRTRRPPITAVDRVFLAAASRWVPRARWHSFMVTPRRCCGGIDTWSPSGGHPRVPSVVRPCGIRFERWWCGSRARTRSGAIHELSAN
jgi:hypothetical protein